MGIVLKSASFRPLTGELFNTFGQKSDMALATLSEIKEAANRRRPLMSCKVI
jgi:hypothetical protein